MPESTPPSFIFEPVRRLLITVKKSNRSITLKDCGQSFSITIDMLLDFANEAIPCVFDEQKVTQPDGDYLKHAINRFRVMLL